MASQVGRDEPSDKTCPTGDDDTGQARPQAAPGGGGSVSRGGIGAPS